VLATVAKTPPHPPRADHVRRVRHFRLCRHQPRPRGRWHPEAFLLQRHLALHVLNGRSNELGRDRLVGDGRTLPDTSPYPTVTSRRSPRLAPRRPRARYGPGRADAWRAFSSNSRGSAARTERPAPRTGRRCCDVVGVLRFVLAAYTRDPTRVARYDPCAWGALHSRLTVPTDRSVTPVSIGDDSVAHSSASTSATS
jgi:hypothetical protein